MKINYKVHLDESSFCDLSINNVLKAIERLEDEKLVFMQTKKSVINDKLSKNSLSKMDILITADEDLGKKWQLTGGKFLYLLENEKKCYPSYDKIVITNNPNVEKPIDHIYDFMLKCMHIYK